MSYEEQDDFMEEMELCRFTQVDAEMLFPAVNLRPAISKVIPTDQLYKYLCFCCRRYAHRAPSASLVFGPDLVTRVVLEATKQAYGEGLSNSAKNLLADPSAFLHSPQDAPTTTVRWLTKSLVEDPLLLHGALVHLSTRNSCSLAKLPLLSICPICHQHSLLRAQLRDEVFPFPSQITIAKRNKTKSTLNRLQNKMLSSQDIIGHVNCQSTLSREKNNSSMTSDTMKRYTISSAAPFASSPRKDHVQLRMRMATTSTYSKHLILTSTELLRQLLPFQSTSLMMIRMAPMTVMTMMPTKVMTTTKMPNLLVPTHQLQLHWTATPATLFPAQSSNTKEKSNVVQQDAKPSSAKAI